MQVPISKSKPRCGAKLRRKPGKCKNPAGARTAHLGEGRCWLHGGVKKPVEKDGELQVDGRTTRRTHGLYAKVDSPRLQELMVEALKEGPRDLYQEVNLLRALVVDYINRYEEVTDALLLWKASFTDLWVGGDTAEWVMKAKTPEEFKKRMAKFRSRHRSMVSSRPTKVLDITSVSVLVDRITKAVATMERIRAEGTVSVAAYEWICSEMGRVVSQVVRSRELLERIDQGWGAIDVTDVN